MKRGKRQSTERFQGNYAAAVRQTHDNEASGTRQRFEGGRASYRRSVEHATSVPGSRQSPRPGGQNENRFLPLADHQDDET